MDNELLLKTIFCCMASDGSIAPEEIAFLKEFIAKEKIASVDKIEISINKYISALNSQGRTFLDDFIDSISSYNLSEEEEIKLTSIAIKTIEADNKIEYSEISFLKLIIAKLKLPIKNLIKAFPDKEDYILPDLSLPEFTYKNNNVIPAFTLNTDALINI